MKYEKSKDSQINRLTHLLMKSTARHGVDFIIEDNPLTYEDVFSHVGGLSLFLVDASLLYEKIYNNLFTVSELLSEFGQSNQQHESEKGITINQELLNKEQELIEDMPIYKRLPILFVEKEEGTFFNMIPRVNPRENMSFSVLSHFAVHVVDEYCIKNQQVINNKRVVSLDNICSRFLKNINNKRISVINEERYELMCEIKRKMTQRA